MMMTSKGTKEEMMRSDNGYSRIPEMGPRRRRIMAGHLVGVIRIE